MVPDVSLQVISSHLFNQGFTMEFIVYLISSLQRESNFTGKTATQVLLQIDRQIIDVSVFISHSNSNFKRKDFECKYALKI